MAVNTKLVKDGEYGQLELNFAAFRRNGAIEAQCRIADGIEYIENGMLLAVNRKNHTVGYPTGTGDVIALNYTTEHMYDERANALKNFRLDKNTFLPRLGYIGVADKFTTNTVCYDNTVITGELGAAIASGKIYGKPCTTAGYKGYIELTKTADGAVVEAIEYTTMPDGSPAVKFVGI